jgi:hypothetical protein
MRGEQDFDKNQPARDDLGPGLTLILGTILVCTFLLAVILLFKP